MSIWSDAMDAHFNNLYAKVPDVDCKGLCVDACGPIDMHPYERVRVPRERAWDVDGQLDLFDPRT